MDHQGNYIENVYYQWDRYGGWCGTHKIEYVYNENNVLVAMKMLNWDRSKNDWGQKETVMNYVIDDAQGIYVAEAKTR